MTYIIQITTTGKLIVCGRYSEEDWQARLNAMREEDETGNQAIKSLFQVSDYGAYAGYFGMSRKWKAGVFTADNPLFTRVDRAIQLFN